MCNKALCGQCYERVCLAIRLRFSSSLVSAPLSRVETASSRECVGSGGRGVLSDPSQYVLLLDLIFKTCAASSLQYCQPVHIGRDRLIIACLEEAAIKFILGTTKEIK